MKLVGAGTRNHCGNDVTTGEEIEFLTVRTVGYHLEISHEMERYMEGGEKVRGTCILPLIHLKLHGFLSRHY